MRDSYTQISVDHFVNNMTGEEYRIGDLISYEPHCSRGDGRRTFTLHGFEITEMPRPYQPIEDNNGKIFEFVYVVVDKGQASSTHLDNVFVISETNSVFREYPSNEWERRTLQNEWTAYKQAKRNNRNQSRKHLLLL